MATEVLYSPSVRRVISPIDAGMTGTIQLDEKFQAINLVHAAPIDSQTMADSFTNKEIGDWEIKEIDDWTDLAN